MIVIILFKRKKERERKCKFVKEKKKSGKCNVVNVFIYMLMRAPFLLNDVYIL